jgi:deoxyribodipyrimidine photolyase-related protein
MHKTKMKKASIIFPHQLFEDNPAVIPGQQVCLVEEFLFFNQYPFHKKKIAFHRAGMQFYASYLQGKGVKVNYIDAKNELSDIRKLIVHLKSKSIEEIHVTEVNDNWLERRMCNTSEENNIGIVKYQSPMFLNTKDDLAEYFRGRKKLRQTEFYIRERKRGRILIDDSDKPEGGKWTYDTDNRLKYPADKKPPAVKFPKSNPFMQEAISYTGKHFRDNYGTLDNSFNYPVTFDESREWLNQFLYSRFNEFGPYEDAIVRDENILNHSVLTPMLNVGLLTPAQVLEDVLEYAGKNRVPLNSLEGFIRQLIGWREFMRGVYLFNGVRQRTTNFWNFNRQIPDSFYDGTTGIEPVDVTIKKILKTGYAHHIERLMILGNFLLLCEFDPDSVYKWFMEMFIDSYDWVMVPNVYGMSQFADGGIMSTKPYISSSNYIKKMSDYKAGSWTEIWDGLFWRFVKKHHQFFASNTRTVFMAKNVERMNKDTLRKKIDTAEKFLDNLYRT